MNMRSASAGALLLTGLLCLAPPSSAQDKNRFKLKPGGTGKVCLACHTSFADKLKSRFVHSPVKSGECSSCHNPHTSSHGKLLAEDGEKICSTCHGAIVPAGSRSTHAVVVRGNCMKCHDPHGSDNKGNLIKAGNELCYDCHQAMGDRVKKAKFKHSPVEKACLSCHSPHAAQKADFLLRDQVPALCLKCHRTDAPAFSKRHAGYPVAKSRCTSCHNAHGSDRNAMLFNTVHKPVASQMCGQCHEPANSKTPLAVKKEGAELCRGCHSMMIAETLLKNRVHWPVMSKTGCLSCHTPHASDGKGLLTGPLRTVCGRCHADSVARQDRSLTKHPPVNDGECTACHAPHSSDQVFLLRQQSVVDLCGACHDWQKHSSHPIGEKVIDPRNRNLSLDCLSCHRSHGTEYKYFIYSGSISDMCTQCHARYKR